jgi:DNA polymerase-3 subunit alpha
VRTDTFIHLHCHSEHSLFDGMAHVKDLIKKTSDLCVPAMALTDHGAVSGWTELHKYAHAAGIMPIFGVEAYMVEDARLHAKQKRRHLVLLAQTPEGLSNLIALSTISATYHYYKPVLDLDFLSKRSKGIIALTACLGGWCARPFFEATGHDGCGTPENGYREFHRLREVLGDRLYLEVQPYADPAQRVFNDWAFDLHDREGTPLVATNDVHYLDAEDAKVHPFFIMAGIGAWQRRGGDGYNDGVEKYVSKPGGIHYRSRVEMVAAFEALHGEGVTRRRGFQAAMAAPFEVYTRAASLHFDTDLKIPKYSPPEAAPSV